VHTAGHTARRSRRSAVWWSQAVPLCAPRSRPTHQDGVRVWPQDSATVPPMPVGGADRLWGGPTHQATGFAGGVW